MNTSWQFYFVLFCFFCYCFWFCFVLFLCLFVYRLKTIPYRVIRDVDYLSQRSVLQEGSRGRGRGGQWVGPGDLAVLDAAPLLPRGWRETELAAKQVGTCPSLFLQDASSG